MAVNKIQIKTGVDMPPRPRRRSKYEAAHFALAEGPIGEAFEIPLPKEWIPDNARLSLAEYAQQMIEDRRVEIRVEGQSLFILKEKAKSGKNGTKGKG